jgi:ferredoxin
LVFQLVSDDLALALNVQAGQPESLSMAYVITDTCTKDEHCIEACPVNCIHPTKDEPDFETVAQLYVNPGECIDCGACVPVCPTNSIFLSDEVPADHSEATDKNAAYFG